MIGRKLGHYRIIEELGSGGMGTVYRAEDTKLRRDVALKVFAPGSEVSRADRQRFLREARAAAALHHPNICTVYDVGEEGDLSYISMAYLPGRSLRDLVQDGPLEVARALRITAEIAKALQVAHEHGIVHRDIKSANIIVDTGDRVTVLDFGIAKLSGHTSDPGEPSFGGTAAYMSPEQATGLGVDHRTDIWSLGVCLYEMVAGELPFQSDHDSAVIYQIVNQDPIRLGQRRSDVPPVLERIVEKALAKRRDARYEHVAEMLADIARAQRDLDARTGQREPSIAVLPFADMSDDRAQDYFCDGIAEEVINSLTQVEGLRVASRTSSFAFRDMKMDIREIGRKLGVDTLLEGSVKKSGSRLRITTQLIDVNDGYHLWSKRFDRDLEDIFAIQDEIARNVVQAMKVTITDNEKRRIEKVPTTNLEAYDFYMRALQHYHDMTRKCLEHARNLFTNAIIRDPNYALAYCGLSNCYSMIVTFYDPDRKNVESALVASGRALQLDAELPEAHAAYGLALSLAGSHAEAEKEFLKAIEMSPKLFDAWYFYARSCRAQGNLEEAAELFGKASMVRPEDYEAAILAADTYRGVNKPEMVKNWSRIGVEAAEKHLEHHPDEARAWYLGAHGLLELGEGERALEWCDRAMSLAPTDPATLYNAACLYAMLGQIDRCFDCFERAAEHGFGNRAWIENDPDLNAIRSDPRYQHLLERLGG